MSNILVVDDNSTDRKIVRNFLERDSHEVYEVSDGSKVFEYLNYMKPDAIILDLFMKHKGGLDTLDELTKYYPEIPVVIVSCVARQFSDVAYTSGAKACFEKPLDCIDFTNAVNELISSN